MTKEKSAGYLYKQSQGYGVSNQVKQYLTPGGWKRMLGENLSSSFQERMNLLRDADKEIREEAKSLKLNFKNANNSFKENRFVDVAHWVAEIDSTVQKIVSYGKSVSDIEDEALKEYYTKTQDADIFKDYFGKKARVETVLLKEAALSDFFNKLLGNSFEQTYWKRIKERKLGVQSLIKQSERIVNLVLSSLKKMGDARATGNIGAWVTEISNMEKGQVKFHEHFKNIYEKHIADLAAMLRGKEPVSTFDEKPETTQQEALTHVSPGSIAPASNVAPTSNMTVPVEQKVNVENKTKEPDAANRGPGRPTRGDKDKQFDQLEQLLKNLKPGEVPATEQQAGAAVSPVQPPIDVKAPEPVITKPVVEPVKTQEELKTQTPDISVSEEDTKPEEIKTNVAPDVKVPEAKPVAEAPKVTPNKSKQNKAVLTKTPEPVKDEPIKPATNKQKITIVVLPKGGVDNLEELRSAVYKTYGNDVVFVSQSSGYDKVDEYKNKGYDIDLKKYEDVQSLVKKGPTKEEVFSKLSDPEFIKNMKRLGNGDFNFGEILDDPAIKGLSTSDKKELVSKLKEIREKEIETNAPVDVGNGMSKPEPDLIGLENEETLTEPVDEDEKIFVHTGKLEKLLGKPLKDLVGKDSYDLISNTDYLKMLPKASDGTYDLELIKKFPEYLVLPEEDRQFFIGPLNMMNKQTLKDNRKKSAHIAFFNYFEKVAATNDPGLMAAVLCKYSEEIDETDPETSVKLLQHAKSLLND